MNSQMLRIYAAVRGMLLDKGGALANEVESLINDLKPGPEVRSYKGNVQAAAVAILETEGTSQKLIDLVLTKYLDAMIGECKLESKEVCGKKYSGGEIHRMVVYGMAYHGVGERLWLRHQYEWIKKINKWVQDEDKKYKRHTDGSKQLARLFAKYATWDQYPSEFYVSDFVERRMREEWVGDLDPSEEARIRHGKFVSKSEFEEWAKKNGLKLTKSEPHDPTACLWKLPTDKQVKQQ